MQSSRTRLLFSQHAFSKERQRLDALIMDDLVIDGQAVIAQEKGTTHVPSSTRHCKGKGLGNV